MIPPGSRNMNLPRHDSSAGVNPAARPCITVIEAVALVSLGADYKDQVRPFLARHCLECHGGQKPKGDLRLDQLAADFAGAANREKWLAVLKRVKAGEMPPKSKPRPSEKE